MHASLSSEKFHFKFWSQMSLLNPRHLLHPQITQSINLPLCQVILDHPSSPLCFSKMDESISQAWEGEGGIFLSAWSDSCDADPRWQHSSMFGASSSCINLDQRHSQGGELVNYRAAGQGGTHLL
jgi:hypothetical protein